MHSRKKASGEITGAIAKEDISRIDKGLGGEGMEELAVAEEREEDMGAEKGKMMEKEGGKAVMEEEEDGTIAREGEEAITSPCKSESYKNFFFQGV